jgi:16S rRNA (guanine527-N7)-methyltransferase
VEVHNVRVEELEAFPVDVIGARAVAPIDKILSLIQGFIGQGHGNLSVLLLKGRQSGEELTAAGKNWTMKVESFPSLTEAGASILRLTDIRRD